MIPTRRLLRTLPVLAAAAAAFALPAMTSPASAATNAAVQDTPKPKPKPQVCTSTESSSSVVSVGECMTTTTISCVKGQTPVISTKTVCTAEPASPK
ncbi:hypothetical protein ACFV9E_08680 [Streptomyces sp. NPDC059835]|uniref:hypothetical protein n=1 Tax=Streptomyces sp. NPDC059835 TaxID=3346967 RepID=UPI00364F9579